MFFSLKMPINTNKSEQNVTEMVRQIRKGLNYCHGTLMYLSHQLFPEFENVDANANEETSERWKMFREICNTITIIKRLKTFRGDRVDKLVDVNEVITCPESLKKYIDSLDSVTMVDHNPEYNTCCILQEKLKSVSDEAKKVINLCNTNN